MFTSEDIGTGHYVAGTHFHEFAVERDGIALGSVRATTATLAVAGVAHLPAYIAERLNAEERERGFAGLSAALAPGLDLA